MLVLLAFSGITYFAVKDQIYKNTLDDDLKLLDQTRYNIDYMNDSVISLCFSVYYNGNAEALMSSHDPDDPAVLDNIQFLRLSIVNTNSIVQSVYIYNGGTVYSTIYGETTISDPSLSQIIDNYSGLPPRLTPIFRTMKDPATGETRRLLTYFMYDTQYSGNKMSRAVIINCDSDWVVNNINGSGGAGSYRMYLLGSDGTFVGASGSDDTDLLRSAYRSYISANKGKTSGIFKYSASGSDCLVTFVTDSKTNFVIIKVQPYSQRFQAINTLSATFAILLAVLILISLIASFSVTNIIYRPIKGIMAKISDSGEHKYESGENEIQFINKVYDDSVRQLSVYKKKDMSNEQIYRSYLLNSLLTPGIAGKPQQAENAIADGTLNLTAEPSYFVCVFAIDGLAEYLKKYGPDDRRLNNYAFINICSELIGGAFPCEVFETPSESIAAIVNAQDCEKNRSTLKELIKKTQNAVYNYFNIEFSASVSGGCGSIREISGEYLSAREEIKYKIIFDNMCIITPDMTAENIVNPSGGADIPGQRELLQKISSGSFANISGDFDEVFEKIRLLSYDSIRIALISLILNIKSAADELNLRRMEPLSFDTGRFLGCISESGSIDELKAALTDVFAGAGEQAGGAGSTKQQQMTAAVKDYIGRHYFDPSLYLPSISDALSLSPRYVGREFKAATGVTINDYINDYRLGKAAEWLLSSQLSIYQVMNKVGFENESYFYRMFKQKYGMTPKAYVEHMSGR